MTSTLLRSAPGGILEQRTRPLGDTDARLIRADGADTRAFVGHAAVFNSRTAIGNPLRWGWYEEIASGAFTKTLDEGDARFLVDHDSRLLVARKSSGDLRLAEDDIGLATTVDPLDEQLSYVRDLARNLEMRRITGMSFGFYVVKDEWSTVSVDVVDDQGRSSTADAELRRITEVRLLEVSAVTFPAYEDTDAGLRALVTEVRAARGLPTDSAPASGGERREPGETTRGGDDAEPGETTRGSQRDIDERARALAARYRIR
jgi:uncharacterized protein